jgi:hypothetical protein
MSTIPGGPPPKGWIDSNRAVLPQRLSLAIEQIPNDYF